MKKKTVSVAFILLVLLLAVSCGEKPTLDNPVKDYDGFKYLTRAELKGDEIENKETGKTEAEKLEVYIPESDTDYVSNNRANGTAQGVEVNVQLLTASAKKLADGSVKKALELYGNFTKVSISNVYEDIGDIKMVNSDKGAIRKGITVKENYSGRFQTSCVTEYCTTLKSGSLVKVSVRITDIETNKKTEDIIKELEDYYGFDIYWDSDKCDEQTEKFTKTPPTTQRILEGGYMIQIPKGWKKDTANSKAPLSVYAKNGNYKKEQLHLIVSTAATGTKYGSITEDIYKKALGEVFKDVKANVNDVKLPNGEGKAFYGTLKEGSTTMIGYFVFYDYRLVTLDAISNGTPTKAQKKVLDDAFDSIRKSQ